MSTEEVPSESITREDAEGNAAGGLDPATTSPPAPASRAEEGSVASQKRESDKKYEKYEMALEIVVIGELSRAEQTLWAALAVGKVATVGRQINVSRKGKPVSESLKCLRVITNKVRTAQRRNLDAAN